MLLFHANSEFCFPTLLVPNNPLYLLLASWYWMYIGLMGSFEELFFSSFVFPSLIFVMLSPALMFLFLISSDFTFEACLVPRLILSVIDLVLVGNLLGGVISLCLHFLKVPQLWQIFPNILLLSMCSLGLSLYTKEFQLKCWVESPFLSFLVHQEKLHLELCWQVCLL